MWNDLSRDVHGVGDHEISGSSGVLSSLPPHFDMFKVFFVVSCDGDGLKTPVSGLLSHLVISAALVTVTVKDDVGESTPSTPRYKGSNQSPGNCKIFGCDDSIIG